MQFYHLFLALLPDQVAQLVEHLPFKERVLGSSPSLVTTLFSKAYEREVYPDGVQRISGSPSLVTTLFSKAYEREVYPDVAIADIGKPQPGHFIIPKLLAQNP